MSGLLATMRSSQPGDVIHDPAHVLLGDPPPVGRHLQDLPPEEERGQRVLAQPPRAPVEDPFSKLGLVADEVGKVLTVPRGDVAFQ